MVSVLLDDLIVDLAYDLSDSNEISNTVSLGLIFKSNGAPCREFRRFGEMKELKEKKKRKKKKIKQKVQVELILK